MKYNKMSYLLILKFFFITIFLTSCANKKVQLASTEDVLEIPEKKREVDFAKEQTHLFKGCGYYLEGKPDKTIEEFEELLKINPENKKVGIALEKIKNYAEKIILLKESGAHPLRLAVININEDNKFSKRVSERLLSSLIGFGRFEVIERKELKKLIEEMRLKMLGIVDDEKAVESGKLVEADILVFCEANENKETKKSEINVRAINVGTGRADFSRVIRDINEDEVSIKLLNVSMDLKQNYPVIVGEVAEINQKENEIIINRGLNNNLREGLLCAVYREGKEIFDSKTGESLGKLKELIASNLRVKKVSEKMSTVLIFNEKISKIKIGDKVITR